MSLIIVVAPLIALGVVSTLYKWRRPSRPYPPGPKGKPLIGNLLDVPKDYSWLTFSEFGKQYGPLAYLNMMGQPVVVINDHKTAVNLLETRGSIYSERYYSVMAMELSGRPCPILLQNRSQSLTMSQDLKVPLSSKVLRLACGFRES